MNNYRQGITADRLRQVLSYCPKTGVFVWKVEVSSRSKIGEVAGCVNAKGYRVIKIDGVRYRAHRLAWLYVHGRWPVDQLDHRNNVRSDNWIKNLREATNAQNQQNRATPVGTRFDKRKGKWRSDITLDWKCHFLGYFDSEQDARDAYSRKKRELHTFNT